MSRDIQAQLHGITRSWTSTLFVDKLKDYLKIDDFNVVDITEE